jgi:hypothetical protein
LEVEDLYNEIAKAMRDLKASGFEMEIIFINTAGTK